MTRVKILLWLRRHPLLLAVVALALVYAGDLLLSLLLTLLPETLGTAVLSLGLTCLMVAGFTAALGYGWAYRQGDFGRTVGAGLGMLIPQALMFLGLASLLLSDPSTPWRSREETLAQLLKLFTIAFWEESVFRGVIANGFGILHGRDGRGVWRAIACTGLVFGALHLTNAFAGVPFLSALVQSIVAVGAGMLLTAIYFRGGSLWGPILIHCAVDAVGLFSSSFLNAASDVETLSGLSPINLLPLVYLLPMTAYVLRPRAMPEALETLAAHRLADGYFPQPPAPAREESQGESVE